MKKLFYSFILSLSVFSLCAQSQVTTSTVKVGDVYEIGMAETSSYKHINFPKANLIIKRGGIASYKNLEGTKVIVTSVKNRKDGTLIAHLKRNDGGRFFGSHSSISANVSDALMSGELVED